MGSILRQTAGLVLLLFPLMCGCEKQPAPPTREESQNTSSEISPAPSQSGPLPYRTVAPPPLVPGPVLPPGTAPTPHARDCIGMRAEYEITPEYGGPSRQRLAVVATDATTVYTHQVAASQFGEFLQKINFNRFTSTGSKSPSPSPEDKEIPVGTRLVTVGTKTLLCTLYETKKNGGLYRTLRCEDVPGEVVLHEDNVTGRMKVRMKLHTIQD